MSDKPQPPLSDEVGQIAIIPDAKLPFDLRIVRQGICVAKVYGVDAQPDWDTANKIAAALTTHQPLSDEVERVSAIIAFNRNKSNFEIAQRICDALTACRPLSDEVERVALAITKALAISHGLRPERAENPAFHRGWVKDGMTAARAAIEVLTNPDGPEAANEIERLERQFAGPTKGKPHD